MSLFVVMAQPYPDRRDWQVARPSRVFGQLGLPAASVLALADAEINRQAAFIAYLDDFWLMMWVTFAAIPLVLLLRAAKPLKPGEPQLALAD